VKKIIGSLFAIAICALVSSQAQGALIAEWQFNSGVPLPSTYHPEYGSESTTATLSATAGSSVSLQQITGTTLNQNTASSPNDALEFHTTGGGAGQNSLVLHITGTGLGSFVLTYATSDSTAATVQTWAYSLDGTTWTTASTVTATSSFATSTVDFSSFNSTLANQANVYFEDIFTIAGNGKNLSFDNIAINATAVPEPITYALAIFGLVFVGGGLGRFYLARLRRTA